MSGPKIVILVLVVLVVIFAVTIGADSRPRGDQSYDENSGWVKALKAAFPPKSLDKGRIDSTCLGIGKASSFLPTAGLGHLRELVSCAQRLWQWRGTRKGLLMVLETTTGIPKFEILESVSGTKREPRAFHLLVRAPESSKAHETLIRRIIELEKPASCTAELEFGAD